MLFYWNNMLQEINMNGFLFKCCNHDDCKNNTFLFIKKTFNVLVFE